MIASIKNVERYRKLIARTLTHRDQPLTPDATTTAITKLAQLVHAYDDDTDALWALGEDEIGLSDLLSGAHAYYGQRYLNILLLHGQWSSTYKALSALGKVVDGVDSLEPDSTAEMVYDGLLWTETD